MGWEAIRRLGAPPAVRADVVMAVSAVAAVVNAVSALLFLSDRKRDLNIGSAFTHLAGDAAIALGVVLAGALVKATGWMWLDPVVALGVSALVLFATIERTLHDRFRIEHSTLQIELPDAPTPCRLKPGECAS